MKIVKTIYESAVVKRNPPSNLKPGEQIYFGGPSFTCRVHHSYIAQIKNATVTFDGIVLKNFHSLKEFIVCYDNDFKSYKERYLLRTYLKNKRLKTDPAKNYILIFDNYSGPRGFAHWLSDGLTRLVEINDQLKNFTALAPYYFKEENIYKETLACFDFGDIHYIPKDSYVNVKNLFVPRQIARTGDYLPQNVLKLRKHIWNKLNVSASDGDKKIYISRKKASRRFVLNEEDVIPLMEKYGFKIVYMEEHSFDEQVKLVYNADLVVSIHGAALANIHFMKTGASVLEFRKEKDGENCMFFSLADALGVNYYYQFCKGFDNSKTGNNFDMLVDCNVLEQNLQLILNQNKIKTSPLI